MNDDKQPVAFMYRDGGAWELAFADDKGELAVPHTQKRALYASPSHTESAAPIESVRETLEQQEGLMHPATQVFFRAGLLACREYMARFVSHENQTIAASIRSNWWPSLGQDFGAPRLLDFAELTVGEYGEEDFRAKTPGEVSPTQEALPIAMQFLQSIDPGYRRATIGIEGLERSLELGVSASPAPSPVSGAREHCMCVACRDGVIHASDCAVHNEPAMPAGTCDCGIACQDNGHGNCRYEAENASPAHTESAAPAFDMLSHLTRQREFSERTFGPGSRAKGVVDHIRKELCEIEADPTDLSEWADVVILALDGFWRAGASPQQIIDTIVAKQTKNEARVWPDWRTMPADKAIEHDRSHDTPAPSPVSGADERAACIAPACHQWDGTDTCTCQQQSAMAVLGRVATALPVLRTMLEKEGLGGVTVADEMIADVRAALAKTPTGQQALSDAVINIDDDLKATDGPLLELDALLANLHQDVWESASQSLCAYDEAGKDEAKKIQRLVRSLIAAERARTAAPQAVALTQEQIDKLAQTHLVAGDDGELFGLYKFARAILAATPAPATADACDESAEFEAWYAKNWPLCSKAIADGTAPVDIIEDKTSARVGWMARAALSRSDKS